MMTHPQRRTPTADGRRKVSVLLTASLVSSLIMLDANIVAVSLHVDGAVARATFTEIEWVVSAYVLPFAALLLAAGAYAIARTQGGRRFSAGAIPTFRSRGETKRRPELNAQRS